MAPAGDLTVGGRHIPEERIQNRAEKDLSHVT